ncbi:MAG TPA: Fic family protein [Fibrobacteraceae bacterium]|nr:Fic family protein [Fibrobacteraceae bacterium]
MAQEQSIRPAGYDYLLEHYQIADQVHWHHSQIAGSRVLRVENATILETFPALFWPGDTPWDHLEFALKYDGIHLGILDKVFQSAPREELIAFIQSKPTGILCRKVWFLYEFLRQEKLPIPDAPRCNYVPILDPEKYYALETGTRIARYRIIDNLLGPQKFCPIVRRTTDLQKMESANHPQQCAELFKDYAPEQLRRALGYLFQKETKSSFEIERETPNATRAERFISLLQLADRDDFCSKNRLLELQNRIVDVRFVDGDYRTTQNYVGQTIQFQTEFVHFVCPKPEDIPSLMLGLEESNTRMGNGGIHPVIHAAVLAYGFVFLHPFEDGNGRIHRFLIHNVLARRGYTPSGMVFPVSATMLKHSSDYDASLEAYSKSVLPQIQYTLDDTGKMVVHNETVNLYRFMDLTPQAEALSRFIATTIDEELTTELEFLRHYDATRKMLREIVDLPDRQMDLFMNLCVQSQGKISSTKRASQFSKLTDEEITAMEQAVQAGFEMKSTDE